jgi:hypothetical protein
MEIIIIILIVLILFFVLRTNYKLSEHEEKTKNILDDEIQKSISVNTQILEKVTSLEQKFIFYQNQLNDSLSDNDSQISLRNRKINRELEQIKADTDIIKSFYLKRSVKKTSEIPSTDVHREEPKKDAKGISSNVVKSRIENKNITIPVSSVSEDFKNNIKEKIENMTLHEMWILKQIFEKTPEEWFNAAEIETDQSNITFIMPKLSRKFIVDGVPIIKIKTLRDKMMIKWGESLTDEKREIVLKGIRGEM